MIFFKLDMADSTVALDKRGHRVSLIIERQLAEVTRRLTQGLDGPIYVAETQGDGMMIGTPKDYALEILRRAMEIRYEPAWKHRDWLPVRMACGVVSVTWPDTPYKPGTGPRGFGIHILSRLMESPDRGGACPDGSLVINAALVDAVKEFNNDLIQEFTVRSITLRGIEGEQSYGIVPIIAFPRWLLMWVWTLTPPQVYFAVTFGAVAWALLLWRWFWS